MKMYQLERTQFLPISIDYAWKFFSKAENLQSITPNYMNFKITNSPGKDIYSGQLITYKVSPLFSVPISWVTEITHVIDGHYFVDEQRFGPFKFWHHQHHFVETDSGTKMTDLLHYRLPFSVVGQATHKLIVKKSINDIFDHRHQVLKARFAE
ncbi:SRPBCC family protein [Shouchella patagoniensis]|uniref:SRPBCC family protein n=1 Tax=Shouchella patagoniensis TaxID=228576 RepID=UPI000995AA7D|nr:SRPBCC family protein [Shouchella patagoniensis]